MLTFYGKHNVNAFFSEGRTWLNKGMAYVEYETYEDVAEAIKMMDGGKSSAICSSVVVRGGGFG